MTEDTQQPILLAGIGGGIAAYKTIEVISACRKAGVNVFTALTSTAQKFVTPTTFEAVSGNKALATFFPDTIDTEEDRYPHLYPATRADVFVVMPATANLISKIAQGRGDDLVSCSALSLPETCQRFFCPAMNVEMWNNPLVQDNVHTLETLGWQRIGPESGILACGMEGPGRLTEPQVITQQLLTALERRHWLTGKKVLICSGPTREHLDPIRFIGNPSSGKMGRALAYAAVRAGATVEFVTGPVASEQLPRHHQIHIHPITSAADMLNQALSLFPSCESAIFVAAVADYTPTQSSAKKLPKTDTPFTLNLKPTADIAATLSSQKSNRQVTIGFALQTHDGQEAARDKLQRKQLDGILLNDPSTLSADQGSFDFLSAQASVFQPWHRISKRECADRLVEQLHQLLRNVASEKASPAN